MSREQLLSAIHDYSKLFISQIIRGYHSNNHNQSDDFYNKIHVVFIDEYINIINTWYKILVKSNKSVRKIIDELQQIEYHHEKCLLGAMGTYVEFLKKIDYTTLKYDIEECVKLFESQIDNMFVISKDIFNDYFDSYESNDPEITQCDPNIELLSYSLE